MQKKCISRLFSVLPIPPFEEFWVAFLGGSIGEIHRTAKGVEHTRVLHTSSILVMELVEFFGVSSS